MSQQSNEANNSRITAELANFALAPVDFPRDVHAAGIRSFVNIVGCALGGLHHPVSDLAYEVNSEFVGAPVATLIGRGRLADVLSATYLNCLAASANAFDDTHLSTVLHPAAPVASALFALVDRQRAAAQTTAAPKALISGQAFLEAFILGIEIQCRLGVALLLPPAQGQIGWYASGVAGGVAAAAASARLLGLSAEKTRWALGIAANQASGFRQTHGSMCTSFTPAHAARCGLHSALLAERGFTASDTALEGANGYFDVFAKRANPGAAVADLGRAWHVLDNAFKPYPCGIVIHPVLDACLALVQSTRDWSFEATKVASVKVAVNPLCLTLCDRPAPSSNQLAQVSVQHWTAAALIRGRAGLAEGSEECVHDTAVMALRAKVSARPDPALARDAGVVVIEMQNGERFEERVEHCIGSTQNPMTDAQLTEKFLHQATPVLGDGSGKALLEQCWSLHDSPSVAELLEGSVPD
jgi:2-methylcitrate dehydratase PrpD